MKKSAYIVLLASLALPITGCQTTKSAHDVSAQASADDAFARAMAKSGGSNASLLMLEKKYKNDSQNATAALNYAHALRQASYLNRASLVLKPFADSEDPKAGVLNEMSMIELAMANYDSAENYAQKAVVQDPQDYTAYQNLGIALDAKEMHPEAERAFRKGLEHWKGDPTTIMNNLALNLATQGFIDEAIEVLERAQALSPDRIEIERNLRIIRTLNER
ncbi:MAG: tetratricopeptide repeat protein [Alphaproteobacteria bacterium]|nr:tetratricopeptide repeat protein [Alphaproteobacteria bacterium]